MNQAGCVILTFVILGGFAQGSESDEAPTAEDWLYSARQHLSREEVKEARKQLKKARQLAVAAGNLRILFEVARGFSDSGAKNESLKTLYRLGEGLTLQTTEADRETVEMYVMLTEAYGDLQEKEKAQAVLNAATRAGLPADEADRIADEFDLVLSRPFGVRFEAPRSTQRSEWLGRLSVLEQNRRAALYATELTGVLDRKLLELAAEWIVISDGLVYEIETVSSFRSASSFLALLSHFLKTSGSSSSCRELESIDISSMTESITRRLDQEAARLDRLWNSVEELYLTVHLNMSSARKDAPSDVTSSSADTPEPSVGEGADGWEYEAVVPWPALRPTIEDGMVGLLTTGRGRSYSSLNAALKEALAGTSIDASGDFKTREQAMSNILWDLSRVGLHAALSRRVIEYYESGLEDKVSVEVLGRAVEECADELLEVIRSKKTAVADHQDVTMDLLQTKGLVALRAPNYLVALGERLRGKESSNADAALDSMLADVSLRLIMFRGRWEYLKKAAELQGEIESR